MEYIRSASLEEVRAAIPDDAPDPGGRMRLSLARERCGYALWRLTRAEIGNVVALHEASQGKGLIRDLVKELPLDSAGRIRPHDNSPLREIDRTNALIDLLRQGGSLWCPPVLKRARWIDALRTVRYAGGFPRPWHARWRIADGRHRLFAAYLVLPSDEAIGLPVFVPTALRERGAV